jgi:lipopolysaccharide transport system permease protein
VGIAWAVLQPVLAALIFSVFLGHLAGVPSNGAPYAAFSFAAMLPWQFFSAALSNVANSLVANANLLTKVYFPRVIIPTASVVPPLVDLAIGLIPFAMVMAWYGVHPSFRLLALPLLAALVFSAALGLGLWLSALNVRFRDVRFLVPFLLQLWMFLSPVAYPASLVKEPWTYLYGLNPLTGIIEGFRWCLLGKPDAPILLMLESALVSGMALRSGFRYFRRTEAGFADVV